MNPLLGRLYETRTRSKTKHTLSGNQDPRRGNSVDKALVPKMAKVKLQSLPEAHTEKRLPNLVKAHIGKLPILNPMMTEGRQKPPLNSRNNFRNRKVSTSIKQMQPNFFATQLDMEQRRITQHHQPEIKPFNPGTSLKKFHKKQQQPVQDEEEQLFEYLKVLETYQDLNEQFCYMNRRQLPYSYYIVDYEDRNRAEYLTVSLRGITSFKEGEDSEFYTNKALSKEIAHYKKIKKIPFFNDYLIVKVMWHWKTIMLRRKFNLKCRYIISHLFSQNLIIQEYMQYVNNIVIDYIGGNFLNFNQKPLRQNLQDFQKMATTGSFELAKNIQKFDKLLEQKLRNTLQTLLSKFRVEERVTLGSSEKKKRQQAYLPFDAKRKSMKYTQMAKLKQFQWTMYRMIKYTDLVRFNSKIDFVRKCYENSTVDLKRLRKSYKDIDSGNFTNWVQMNLSYEGAPGNASLVVVPTIPQLQECMIEIKQCFLRQLYTQNYLLIDERESLFCQNVQLQNEEKQKPSKFDLKYFILKQPEFIRLKKEFQDTIKGIMGQINAHLNKIRSSLLKIYNKNIMSGSVESYLTNQAIRNYLQEYRQDYETIMNFQSVAQYALCILMISNIKEETKKISEQKFKMITQAVPGEVTRRCHQLQDKVRNVYKKFKENPYTIAQYIVFDKNFRSLKPQISTLEREMEEVLEFEALTYNYNIKIGQVAKLSIQDVQVHLKELIKRLNQIQENEEKERKRFEVIVDQLIPGIQEKSEDLLKDLKANSVLNNHTSEIEAAKKAVTQLLEQYERLYNKKKQLFEYQTKLDLGHKELEQYNKMQAAVKCIQEVWKAREYYLQAYEFVSSKGYGKIAQLDTQPLNAFLANSDKYTAYLQCFQLLHEFKQLTTSLLKTIKLSRHLSSATLAPQHLDQIKHLIKSTSKDIKSDLIFSHDSKNKITPLMLVKNTNIDQLQDQISQIVFLSEQENIVKTQIMEIEDFWKKNKIKLIQEDIAKNEHPILHLDHNQELHQKLGYFVVMLKNIQGSPHMAGMAHQRAVLNAKMTVYLRDLLWQWQKVQKEWRSLLPVMANYSAVKHQSNVFFEFTSVDTSIKKFIRQISEIVSLKRLVQDHHEKKYMHLLEEYQEKLNSVSKVFMSFLQSKRATYGRFCFLSDHELIQMLQYVKDARTTSKFISRIFFSEKLVLDGQLMAAFGHSQETFKTRKMILKGQPDEILKAVEQNMRTSIKLMLRTLLPKLKISEALPSQTITQVILLCDKIIWTQMSELYLTTNTYDDYKLLLRKEQQKVVQRFQTASKAKWLQTALRLGQLMHLRQIGLELMRQQITPADFKWKQQIRLYLTEQDIQVCHFDGKMTYSCEYRPPTHISIPTNTSTRFLYESYRACQTGNAFVVSGFQGQGKRNLAEQASSMLGTYFREIICTSKLSIQFLLKIVQGVLSAGAWVSFYQFDNLNYSVCAELLANLYKSNALEHKNNTSLFMLIYHGDKVQQISPFSFVNFAVIEPQKERICEWLLKLYRFKRYEDVSKRLTKFMKVVKPFLNKAFGSQLRLTRQVIINAGKKRMGYSVMDEHSELKLITDALRDEIIFKQEQTKAECLNRALYAHFGIELSNEIVLGFTKKVQTIVNLLQEGAQGIIVLGQRSCKSTAIHQAIQKVGLQQTWLYPQSKEVYFYPEAIDFMRSMTRKNVVVYDGNQMLVQWADLMTAGHLFIDGNRAFIDSQVIMELRSIDKCSPSFVSKCQIVYMGSSIVSRWQKFLKMVPEEHFNHQSLSQALLELYGKNLQNIQQDILLKLISLISRIPVSVNAKSMFRLVVWMQAMHVGDHIWVKQFGGSCFDFMLTGGYQLVPADPAYYQEIHYPGYKNYLLVPTRKSSVVMSAICQLLNIKTPVHIMGSAQSGKTSILNLLFRKLTLSSHYSVDQWGQRLKKKFTYVRRERLNWLIDFEKQGTRFVVDDLDLGQTCHKEFLRELVQTSAFRDKHFGKYHFEKVQYLGLSRKASTEDKYWSHVFKANIPDTEKASIESIYRVNLASQMNDYNMSREVQQLISGKIIKSCLIASDDLSNLIGQNEAASLVLGLLRNLLSLPKAQCHLSVEQYIQYFKTHFHARLYEKGNNEKLLYNLKNIQLNILKVIFNEKPSNTYLVNLDGQYKTYALEDLSQKIQKKHPEMVMFPRLIQTVVYICNQIRCMDRNIVLLGRRGTGKRFLAQICAQLTGLTVTSNTTETILAAIKHKKILYLEQIEGASTTLYEDLFSCEIDKDLQKLIEDDKRQAYYSAVAGQNVNENKLVHRCRDLITFLFICDQRESYSKFSQKRRQIVNMPVCLVDQWPTEAIINLYTINDPNPQMHAELFNKINTTLSKQKMPTIPLKTFQKYLKVFYQIESKMSEIIEAKVQLHKDIHFKFNESFELVSAWEKRVDILRVEIEESIIMSGQNIVANQVANMCLAIFCDQIKAEKEKSAKEEYQLKVLKYQIERRLELIHKVKEKIQKLVASFQRTELGELKKVFKANLLVYFGVECLCILLGQENHDDKTINRLLADPNLLMRMKASQILQNRNLRLEAKYNKQILQFKQDLQQNENQLAKTVLQWIKSIIEYWATTEKQKVEEKQYEEAKLVLAESTRKHTELKAQVETIRQIIKQKLTVVERELQFKANKELQLSTLSKRLENAVKIIPVLKNEQIEAKKILEELKNIQSNLRGNCLLAAVTATFLPLRTLTIKQEILKLSKKLLRDHSTSFSQNFMAELSNEKANSLQSLNFFLIQKSSLPKVVLDPQRKFLLFLQENADQALRQGVIQNSEQRTEFERGKIYHTTSQCQGDRDRYLLIEWSAVAVEEKEAIFLQLAEFKRPEYFVAKKELQVKINNNLKNVLKLKEVLYSAICQKEMKIIQDDGFVAEGQQLRSMEKETLELKAQAQQKIKQIEALTRQINTEATKIIHIYKVLKHYRALDLDLILDVCCREGDSVQYLLQWALSNVQIDKKTSFLLVLTIAFRNDKNIDMLRDIINGSHLQLNESPKLKKPPSVSSKHWQTALKLSTYGGSFKELPENISKCQKQFETWCIDQSLLQLPHGLFSSNLQFIEQLALLYHFKPSTCGYLAWKMLSQYLPYELQSLKCRQIFLYTNRKFPILARYSIEDLKRMSTELNEGRYSLVRVSKLNYEADMKRAVWRSMQAKQWLLCYDYQNKNDLKMLQMICYYVMNYEKQANFRVIIVVDHIIDGKMTTQEQLVKGSSFLSGISVQLYPQDPSYDSIFHQTNSIEYQVGLPANQSSFGNRQIFNSMYRTTALCYTALVTRYPKVRTMPFKRIMDTLSYIKNKSINIEFNIFTIVNYLSRVMSGQTANSEERREIEELWDFIVDERKIIDKKILNIPIEEDNLEKYIKGNIKLVGLQESHEVRLKNSLFETALTQLSEIYGNGKSAQEELAFIRSQLGRLPVLIKGKECTNKAFSYFYDRQLQQHNQRLSCLKNLLQDINKSSAKENYLETLNQSQKMKLKKFVKALSIISNEEISFNRLRQKFLRHINKIKAEHDFLLYFNPNLPILIIDPSLLNNLRLLVSSYFIDRFCRPGEKQAYKLNNFIKFTKHHEQKQILAQGIYLSKLKCKQFVYHHEQKSIGPSYETDGFQPCPILSIVFHPAKVEEGEEVDDLDMVITSKGNAIYEGQVEYNAVFFEWGFRSPKIVTETAKQI